jgi:hypothetical protein
VDLAPPQVHVSGVNYFCAAATIRVVQTPFWEEARRRGRRAVGRRPA